MVTMVEYEGTRPLHHPAHPQTVSGWCNANEHDSSVERSIIGQGRITCTCQCHEGEK